MEQKQKILARLGILAGAILLAFLAYQGLQKSLLTAPKIVSTPLPTGEQNSGVGVYTDPTLNFTLEIPHSWDGYYKATPTTSDRPGGGPIPQVRFDYVNKEGKTIPLFYIAQTTEKNWRMIQALSSMLLTKLIQVENQVYYTEDARTYPRVAAQDTDAQYKKMSEEISRVLQTFSLFSPKTGMTIRNNKVVQEVFEKKLEIQNEYPVFISGQGIDNYAELNAAIENLVNQATEITTRDMNDNDVPVDEDIKNGFGISYTIDLFTPERVSIEFNMYEYSRGAAHPNSFTQVLNFDLKTKKVLKLEDVFQTNKKYLERLSEISFADLTKQMEQYEPDKEWLKRGTEPKAENFQKFVFVPGGIKIIFDSYQVGPYVLGPQEVRIPTETIKDILQ